MKFFIYLLTFSAIVSSLQAAAPTSIEGLISTVKQAIEGKNPTLLESLVYSEGMSDADKQLAARTNKMLVESAGPIDEITSQPLPDDFQPMMVANGKKYETTVAPAGRLQIKFRKVGNGSSSQTFLYAEVGGAFYLVGAKSTHLDWTGPPDQQIGFMVLGYGPDGVEANVKWNASGVIQEQVFKSPSAVLRGQYIESVTATSPQKDANLTLTIRENGTVISTVEGKGTVKYERP